MRLRGLESYATTSRWILRLRCSSPPPRLHQKSRPLERCPAKTNVAETTWLLIGVFSLPDQHEGTSAE